VISEYAWLIPALPALSAVIITFFGKQFPKRGAEVGIVSVAVALALSVWLAIEVWGHNAAAARDEASASLVDRAITLTPIGGDFTIELAMRVDGLVAMMFLLVTFVSLMVQVYSAG
jgi:NADH-quinone oxidoreductase subunit L